MFSLRDQISEVSYLVGDLEKSVDFYSLVFGMKSIKTSKSDGHAALLSFPDDSINAAKLSFVSKPGVNSYDVGNVWDRFTCLFSRMLTFIP